MSLPSVAFFTVSCAQWRLPEAVPMPHILVEDLDEDALDQETVSFEDAEEDLAYQGWYEDRIMNGDFEPWCAFEDEGY